MTTVVRMLHDQSSQLMDMLIEALRDGKLCVIDVSQLRGAPALVLSGLILNRIFDSNQDEFTKAVPKTIPTIAVIEEAQSVLGNRSTTGGEAPYVAWVKEGRKYDLGAVMITQQPGSISSEILSQGDNWFLFHLLSAGDLQAVHKANAHFSDDLLSVLLNEPIPGHGVFWSSSGGRPYPVSIRALLFESTTKVQDPSYSRGRVETYASKLRVRFAETLTSSAPPSPSPNEQAIAATVGGGEVEGVRLNDGRVDGLPPEAEPVDVMAVHKRNAIAALRGDKRFMSSVKDRGVPWRGVMESLKKGLPESMVDRDAYVYGLVPEAMNELFGAGGWRTERKDRKDGKGSTVWVTTNGAA